MSLTPIFRLTQVISTIINSSKHLNTSTSTQLLSIINVCNDEFIKLLNEHEMEKIHMKKRIYKLENDIILLNYQNNKYK